MSRHFKNVPDLDDAANEAPTPHESPEPAESHDIRQDLPSVEDGGLGDHTVASPALGFGMDRVDMMEDAANDFFDEASAQPQYQAPPAGYQSEYSQQPLGRNEVAAISGDRQFYVSDVPSPYLSKRQAQEDVRVTRRRHSRITAFIVIVIFFGGLGAAGWFIWSNYHTQEHVTVQQYETRNIEAGEYLETIDVTSLVQPVNEVAVTSNVSGTIAEKFVENDQDVQEGDWLFRLENPTITDALNKAGDTMNSYQSEVDAKQAALDKANDAVKKAEEAVAKDSKDAAAKSALEKAKNDVALAQNALDTAHNSLASIQDTYAHAQEQVDELQVYAPISGKVSELSDQAAPSSSVSGSTRLCTISDTSKFSLTMEIPASEQNRVQVGQEVRISFPAIEDLKITSAVSSIDESEDGGTLFATVDIENPDERIKTGVVAEASLVLKSVPDTLIVPANALHTNDNGSTHLEVLLDASRGIVTDVPVTVLATDGTRAAVEADNIQADTAVVVPPTE